MKVPVSRSGPIKGTGTAPPWRHRLDNCDLSPLTKISCKKPIIVHSEFDKCALQILPRFAVFSTILPSYTLRSLALFSHNLRSLALFSHNLRSLAPSTKQSPRSCFNRPDHGLNITTQMPKSAASGLSTLSLRQKNGIGRRGLAYHQTRNTRSSQRKRCIYK